ncbi:MAG: hypothetical protein KJ720_09465 [Proteobacteria bacterium]|nr:hypothetical protein [Pseudomonadota bacterium]MBU1452780.1 hypothetical protein [Pseudomonadota bacterium]MBU2469093.1 hypothetical protein [Pseudomonadota bacterium]MBU2519440.1 hypothetical protein [Pseudomonadota bacterium]
MGRLLKTFLAGLAAVLAVSLAGGAWAQGLNDCKKTCAQMQDEGVIGGPVQLQQCIDLCGKFKDAGIDGISFKCSMNLTKACGFELAWDLIRYCFKPCIEFKKDPCEDCLVKHSFCQQGSACRDMVCECFKIPNCQHMHRKICDK